MIHFLRQCLSWLYLISPITQLHIYTTTRFCSLQKLQYISLPHNLLKNLQIGIFQHNPDLQVLILESNNINSQSVIIDGSLPLIYRLSSDLPRLCCAFKAASFCSPSFPFFMSCRNLITSKALILLGWIIGLSTSLLCIFCLLLLLYKLFITHTEMLRILMLFSLNLNLSELVISLCLLSYPVINVVYNDVFGITADKWRQSWECFSLECLFSISSQSSLAFAVCLSVHFAINIPSVIRKETSQKVTFFKIITIWLLITPTSIVIQILENAHSTDPFNYFCFPFTTQFPSDNLIFGLDTVMVIFDRLLLMICIISYGYLLMFTLKRQRNKTLQSVDKRKARLQKLGARFVALILSTVLTWVPILCVQIWVLLQITVSPNIYFWCILVTLPVNLIIDPILLISNLLA